jgi:uncharacterized protein YcnI
MNRSSVFLTRLAVVAASAATVVLTSAGLASAHVTVSSPDATAGGFGKVTFRVPNESDTAGTVKIRIQLPTDKPLASVATMPVPGWTATTTKKPVNPPVKDDDGNTVNEAVSVVEFDAAPGGGIAPGEFQEFSLSGGPFPKAASVTFPIVQTYSDGSESPWIDPTVQGQPEPQHPAPVLSLSGGQAAGGTAAAPTTDAGTATTHDHGSQLAGSPAGVALFLAILALVVGAAGVVLGARASRRTVGS